MRRIAALLGLLLLLASPGAWAAESNVSTTARDRVSLISDTDHVAAGTAFHLALHFQLAAGWHTYWRNPGDAGVPAQIHLSLPPGTTAGPIAWPTPARIAEGPVMTYAYTGQVMLTQRITPPANSQGIAVKAHVDWLVCKQICVPESADFILNLPPGTPAPSAQAPIFAAAHAAVPHPAAALSWQARIAPDGMLGVAGPGLEPDAVAAAWFIPDGASTIVNDAAQTLRTHAGGLTLALHMASGFHPGQTLDGILVVRDRRGAETAATLSATPGTLSLGDATALASSALRLLGFAFLGGIILNLMPCVFPVLAMKALGLAQGGDARRRRTQALSYTAGVVAMFLALGLVLLAGRAGGAAAGWGFQFQSPIFVVAMAWLMFAIGLNLSGVFAMGPGALGGLGQGLAARGGHAGSFFTGLLAVLVATPCTAPFMGVAIAGALTASVATVLGVFLSMGLGLAAPYVVLATAPGLARLLPRPGTWMEVLRQALAFPMFAATVWLVWVASQESGSTGVLAAGAGLVLLGCAAWLLGLAQRAAGRIAGQRRKFVQTLVVACLLGAVAILSGITPTPAPAQNTANAANNFSVATLTALRHDGRPVLVDISAAWCVSCLVNERVALDRPAVRAALKAGGIAYLRGDWTRQDPTLTAFLRAHGHDGVPLYLFYPKGGGTPRQLPQILTEASVLAALKS